MARQLDVYLLDTLIGKLMQDEAGRLSFAYDASWLTQHHSFPLSQSLPLQTASFSDKECHAFFGGILPEEEKRQMIAQNLGISARNDFAMLEHIGGECAGAITFLLPRETLSSHKHQYREISESELAAILRDLPERPLMAGDQGVRLSLAGVQDKIAIAFEKKHGSILLPLDGSPSTHIIKPEHTKLPGLIENEAFCLQLAEAVGLPAAVGTLRKAETIRYLAVQRYDRIDKEDGKIERLHQEDFCQALGIAPELKHQAEGGPSLKACFDLIRTISSAPVLDIRILLDAVIFNFLVGNHDAHGKNFSLLYKVTTEGIEIRLAPLYDLICTAAYPHLSDRMAMSIAKQYRMTDIYPRHFEQFALEVGLAAPMVKKRVINMAQKIIAQMDNYANDAVEKVIRTVRQQCDETLKRFDA